MLGMDPYPHALSYVALMQRRAKLFSFTETDVAFILSDRKKQQYME